MLNKYRKSGDTTFIKKFELMNMAEKCFLFFFFCLICARELLIGLQEEVIKLEQNNTFLSCARTHVNFK